ncbi:MAG: glycosyltransferase, partial [Lachnospiraceae bacterium]|nr:glycosyltransferase [Lachnospiraceae bacterium]
MKVTLLNDSFPPVIDGVANVVMNYARIMTETGKAEAVVATPRYPEADYTGYPYAVVPYQSFDTTGIVNGYRAGNPFAMKAIEQLTTFRPDIIHTHCPVSSTVMARILRNETGAPVVFTYHTKFDVDIARAVSAKFIQKESIKALADNITACDEVWVVSRGAGDNMKSLGYEGEYRVMPNGVDFAKGRVSDEEVAKAVAGYDLPADVPVFLFVGRMMKYKGLPIILDAMKLLAGEGMDFRMIFVGGGLDAEEMQQKAKDDGIWDKVIFTGPEHDRMRLRAWNTRADLFLFPSTYDTNGIVVREAAACGLASVLIKDSCAAEGITDGRNGYIIEESAEAMAACLREACKDMERVHQVGQHAMDEIYISWDTAVNMAYERYGEILELKNRGMLPARKHETSDYFLNIAANLVEKTDKVFKAPRRIYEGMQENVAEMRENMEGMREEFQENMSELREGMRENVAELREGMRENMAE